MDEAAKTNGKSKNELSEKQIDFALNTRKPMFVENAKELLDYLQKQNDPKWWLDRRKFDWCVSTYVKMKSDQWFEQHPEKRPQQKPEQNQNNSIVAQDTPPKPSFSQPQEAQTVESTSTVKL